MKRLAALFAVCCLLFGVTACSDVTIQKETPPVTTGIMAADNPLLTAPPFQADTENAAIVYDTLTQAQIAEYEQALKQAGYESGNDAEHFWYNGTSMLRLSHDFDTDSGLYLRLL